MSLRESKKSLSILYNLAQQLYSTLFALTSNLLDVALIVPWNRETAFRLRRFHEGEQESTSSSYPSDQMKDGDAFIIQMHRSILERYFDVNEDQAKTQKYFSICRVDSSWLKIKRGKVELNYQPVPSSWLRTHLKVKLFSFFFPFQFSLYRKDSPGNRIGIHKYTIN